MLSLKVERIENNNKFHENLLRNILNPLMLKIPKKSKSYSKLFCI